LLSTIKNIPQKWKDKLLWSLVTFFALAWLLTVIELFLAHTGVNYESKDAFVNRHLYKLSGLFYETRALNQERTVSKSSGATYANLNSWSLQALYHEDNGGFAVVVISGKTHFINQSEMLQGYKLDKVEDKKAYFSRQGQRYQLSLDTEILEAKEEPKETVVAEPLNISDLKSGIVSRTEINRRMKDPKLIWSEIKISIYKKDNIIKGFVVRSVKHNSVFHHLGLKRGDIIVTVNGEPLDTLEKVQSLYKNITEVDALVVGVKRSGKLKELRYEIR